MSRIAEAIRFVAVGGANTLVTAVALSLLARVINPRIAYAVVYLVGIGVAMVLVSRVVFRTKLDVVRGAQFTVMYIAVFLTGLLALQIALSSGLPRHFSGAVVLVTAPLSFLGSRWIFASAGGPTTPAPEGVV